MEEAGTGGGFLVGLGAHTRTSGENMGLGSFCVLCGHSSHLLCFCSRVYHQDEGAQAFWEPDNACSPHTRELRGGSARSGLFLDGATPSPVSPTHKGPHHGKDKAQVRGGVRFTADLGFTAVPVWASKAICSR